MNASHFTPKFTAALIGTGIAAGLVGIGFTHLLHAVQQLVFLGHWADGHIPFGDLVRQASPERRFAALLACGAVVGILWTLLQKYGAPLLEVKAAVRQPEKNMPVKTTACHAVLQIITVGMGSPLGREVAPREMSVALATPLSGCLKRLPEQKSVLLACASGAGLAAVYNVPLAAAVFNFGYLPRGSKHIATQAETSLAAVKSALSLLRAGGLLAAVLYHGHEAGKPETAVLSDFAAALPQEQYRVLRYTFPNQRNCPPVVLAVEKLAEAA